MKRKDPATKNQKYLAIFLALTMLLSAVLVFVSYMADSKTNNDDNLPAENQQNNSTIPFSQIPGKQVSRQFNSISDGLNMTPEGVTNAIYVDLQKSTGTPMENMFGSKQMLKSIYGADVTKRYSTSYSDGTGFELHQIPERKILPPWGAVQYDGYTMLARTNTTYDIWNVVGSPVILGPRHIVQKVIDVLEGNETATAEYNEILSYATPQNIVFQEIVAKSNMTEIPADQYYRDLKKLDNGSYTQTSIFQNPEPQVTKNITTYQANASERGVTYNVITAGNITKLEITSDFANLYNETQLLSL
ncbi:MAG: hypothetical protein ACPK85_16370 [Methanosarcina sp.]